MPFDHDGKPAYRAYVYRCGSGAPFVGFLGRRTAGSFGTGPTNTAEAMRAMARHTPLPGAIEVKKPGQTKWVSLNSPQGEDIANLTCPDGGRPQAVFVGD